MDDGIALPRSYGPSCARLGRIVQNCASLGVWGCAQICPNEPILAFEINGLTYSNHFDPADGSGGAGCDRSGQQMANKLETESGRARMGQRNSAVKLGMALAGHPRA